MSSFGRSWIHGAARAIAAGGFKANPEPRDEDGEKVAAIVSEQLKALAATIHKSI